MKYTFPTEFFDSQIGFWIFSREQTYAFLVSGGIFLGIFSLFLGVVMRVVLAIIAGGIVGFLIANKYSGIFGYLYILEYATFLFGKLISPQKKIVLFPANYPTSATQDDEEVAYAVTDVQTSLPEKL